MLPLNIIALFYTGEQKVQTNVIICSCFTPNTMSIEQDNNFSFISSLAHKCNVIKSAIMTICLIDIMFNVHTYDSDYMINRNTENRNFCLHINIRIFNML